MISGPNVSPALLLDPVSSLDIPSTLADLAGVDTTGFEPWTDGESLVPQLNGSKRQTPVLMEYAAEGSYAPLVSIRESRYKFNHCELDPPQLFDLENDPRELTNLAEDPEHAGTVSTFIEKIRSIWDMKNFDAEVRDSQARRWVVYDALRQGRYQPWDFEPNQHCDDRYMRNHMDLNVVEGRARFPKD
jgi:choline-sulfatase